MVYSTRLNTKEFREYTYASYELENDKTSVKFKKQWPVKNSKETTWMTWYKF